jgi:hypothetical protein
MTRWSIEDAARANVTNRASGLVAFTPVSSSSDGDT